MKKVILTLMLLPALMANRVSGQDISNLIRNEVASSVAAAEVMYRDLHQNPELSLMEFNTAAKMADALGRLGFEVTTGVGGNGVVGVLRNGKGPVIMLRADMDALPVRETTGLPFASTITVATPQGPETPVMHACGHDLHMTVWHGTVQTLVALKSKWKGTLVAIAQPAEEVSGGSDRMIADGLYSRFPKPDYALCYHVSADLPAGTVGYFPGAIFAGVNSADLKVFGVGGHGAMPHKTIDPVVLSAKIILDYQTIVSREINPVYPAVVTVGSIHGGTKHNIIPGEVEMKLTLRFFSDGVYNQITEALVRIANGHALAAGLPEEMMPVITFPEDFTPPVENDANLVGMAVASMENVLGKENVIRVDPATVAEDFGKYGRTDEKVKIALFWLGGVNREKYDESIASGTNLPALHSSNFAPDFVPAYTTGATAMTRAVMDLFNR
ncbi:MAG TPA: amidohydrolase [Bacteroidales bacterium]|jgi:hippurate hydrolase|nr:amidohydrolase [Bacteroidales bacterium]MDI9532070.1 amidohydrolase [Bacteroidota bacterium]MBP8708604.1 amidohydrolase [Bacteroidales bacterium]MZQ79062.1 amidohydrolase [Bacteroidales bacterium]HHU99287.1 amidohydrolase [Bacteroidales bacterium]